ncbi:MAG: DUF2306 domain-containing protein [Pseudomonadota bacterium]
MAPRMPALPSSRLAGWLLTAAAALATAVLFGPRLLAVAAGARPHAPDLALFAIQPAVIQVHVLAALGAVAVGALILAGRKGDGLHRVLGWTWTILMGGAAASSLFIVGFNGDVWSIIHLLSGWTLVSLPVAIAAARSRNIGRHRQAMTGVYWGASIVAGLFAFLPGRLMWRLFMG